MPCRLVHEPSASPYAASHCCLHTHSCMQDTAHSRTALGGVQSSFGLWWARPGQRRAERSRCARTSATTCSMPTSPSTTCARPLTPTSSPVSMSRYEVPRRFVRACGRHTLSSQHHAACLCAHGRVRACVPVQEQILDHIFTNLRIDSDRITNPIVMTEVLCNPSYCRQRTPARSYRHMTCGGLT
jgi:hypothetical protein